jgi:hypothetical protein
MNAQVNRRSPVGSSLVGSAVVVTWFLWPFTRLSPTAVAYAMAAGPALFLVSWFGAGASGRFISASPVARALLVGLIAFAIGLGAGVGYSIGTSGLDRYEISGQVPASAMDAVACVVGAAAALLLARRRSRRAVGDLR